MIVVDVTLCAGSGWGQRRGLPPSPAARPQQGQARAKGGILPDRQLWHSERALSSHWLWLYRVLGQSAGGGCSSCQGTKISSGSPGLAWGERVSATPRLSPTS